MQDTTQRDEHNAEEIWSRLGAVGACEWAAEGLEGLDYWEVEQAILVLRRVADLLKHSNLMPWLHD